MARARNLWLTAGGVLSLAVALLHVVIVFVGAPAYRSFGAGEEMARASEKGSAAPAVLTLGLAAVFAAWGVYALSGAGLVRRLPLLRTALVLVGAIYTLRGLALLQLVLRAARTPEEGYPREFVFSLVSLLIGSTYLVGAAVNWRGLGVGGRDGPA